MKKNVLILGLLILASSGFAQNKSKYSPDPSVYKNYIGQWESQDGSFQLEILPFELEFNGEINHAIAGFYKYYKDGKIIQKTPIEEVDPKKLVIEKIPLIGGYDESNNSLRFFMKDPINKKRGIVKVRLINDKLHWELKPNPGEKIRIINLEEDTSSLPFSIPKNMILKRKKG
ncbi:hypothetical protein BH23BAC2_BH23BAC2_24710 [soil metagenome]